MDARATATIDAQAERAALVARLESALMDRCIIKRAPVTTGDVTIGRTEYRFQGDTSRAAFAEPIFRLATDTNSPSVARSMIDVAEARNWKALRFSGNEDFKRMVWLEASVPGVKTLGYEPNPGDLEALKREREARLVNRIGRPGMRAVPHR
ncbi:MAG: LPD7 domain-containing protein [Betaproteobacteria bacterium]